MILYLNLFLLTIAFIGIFIMYRYLQIKYNFHNLIYLVIKKEDSQNLNISNIYNYTNSIEEALIIFFKIIEEIKSKTNRFAKSTFHWLLHLFVVFLKYISIYSDKLYTKSRDFFLKTATKEKEVVTVFWHHLKEYKKEKESEKE